MNKLIYDLQLTKTISSNLTTQNINWEVETFKGDQKKARSEASRHYDNVVEKLIIMCEGTCKEVVDRTMIKESTDLEDTRFGKQVKQKPMNVIRKEKEERIRHLELAKQDKSKLRNFIRLVDYITLETLFKTNSLSIQSFLEEMKKEGRKSGGLFNSTVIYDISTMAFTPDERDITETLLNILEEMVKIMKNTTRVIEHQGFDPFLKILGTATYADIQEIILESVEFGNVKEEINQKILQDFTEANKFVTQNYELCRPIHNDSSAWNQMNWEKEEHSLEEIKAIMVTLNAWKKDIKEKILDANKGIVNVNGARIRGNLGPHVNTRLDGMKDYLYKLMGAKSLETAKNLQDYLANLNKQPNILSEYAKFIENLNEAKDKKPILELEKTEIDTMHNLLRTRFEVNPLKTTDAVLLEDINSYFEEMKKKIDEAEQFKKDKKPEMMLKLEKGTQDLQRDIVATAAQVNSGRLVLDESEKDLNSALKDMNIIKTTLFDIKKFIERFKAKDRDYTHYQKLMELTPPPNKELVELEEKYNDRKTLWTNIEKFARCHEEWFKSPFLSLNSDDIEKDMKGFEKSNAELKQRITSLSSEGKDKVLDLFVNEVRQVSNMMGAIVALANKDLKPRHWRKIFDTLNPNWQPSKTFNFVELIANGVMEKKEAIEEISSKASGEAQIDANIESIAKKWTELTFTVNNYREAKDKFVIGTVEEIVSTLDDHQVSVQTMLGTRFVSEIRDKVEEWEKKLVLISDILDEWLYCQRNWMYLENIFNAEDIQKQLPEETRKFFQVDKFWKEIMQKTHKRPIVQECCSSEDLLRKFQQYNKALDDIQKCLENYLDSKRLAFPRFYFLSNDELLEILSQTRNPHAVQNHLRKCFDNINRIRFTDVDDSREIIAMQSAEPEIMPEKVPLSSSVLILPEDRVEQWLMKIQEMMFKTIYDITKLAFHEYPEDGLDRKEWLFAYPAQPVLTVDLITWTEAATKAILEVETGHNAKGLIEFFEFMKELMNRMVEIVRGELNTLERTMMGALIVLDVHGRDVIELLINNKVKNVNDFEWTKQLRYYWDTEVDNCVVRQTNTKFNYGFEYLGNSPRLVITPLTDKCYMTLTGALHLNYGGNPQGPAGTGKTETTKDLAKALAIQCVVFNCSDSLDYKTMGRFFNGLAQCGAWSCFDEFNRIDIEVLSVIAQQILTIQQAVRAKLDLFEFEGKTIPLNLKFGVFITMNPGYAGRTELPDNLKALFRPIAMMIPDYALIAEIILFSEGFETARVLANKMVQLYKLSSEQLSKQDHYDFGMRAVKSVLVMAGALRRSDPATREDIVLIRAMRDSNIPKFLSHDLPLFQGIIQDLFPKVEIPIIKYEDLERAIFEQLDLEKLQKPKLFIIKILQLMETIKVRHGVMLVGVTGTGKTKCYSTLAKAVAQLNKEGSQDYYHKQVNLYKLNPKSVTMNDLFGFTNLMTNEWTDGIVAKIVRDAVIDTTDYKKWIIFDGPVDALWIENLNTVLDDNKMLCLPNGQRIKLPQTFTMMFEVQDLAVASPATVSRCGMVYLEPNQLGWEPILDTWGYFLKEKEVEREREKEKEKNKEKGLEAPQREIPVPAHIINLIEKVRAFFNDNFGYLRLECKEVVPSVDVNLVKSCLNLINVMLDDWRTALGAAIEKLTPYEIDNYINMIFIFSFVWSAGGNLQDLSRVKFSQYMRQKFLKLYSSFLFDGEVFDYFIDFQKKEFRRWTDILAEYKFKKEIPYFNILVPTADTVKYKFLLDKLISGGNNVLIAGETGVGKSVIIQEYLMTAKESEFVFSTLNFSAQTSSKNLQDLFMDKDKFIRKKKDLIGPPSGKKMLVFIDDVNMPQLEKYGAQPPIELLRQIIDHGGFFELKRLLFMNVKDCLFITSCAPPGGGRNAVTPRLFRHFNMLWMPDLSNRSMETIFNSILKGFLMESGIQGLEKYSFSIVRSSIEIYMKITKDLLPTPSKSHYTFNLRDLSKVFQGILQIRYENLHNKENLILLWIHEACRVFHDRLTDEKDRDWFYGRVQEQLKANLEFEAEKDMFGTIIFGDYTSGGKEYMRLENPNEIINKFTDYLTMYNINSTKTMNLVFFQDAINHLSRICRILRQTRGNALLIGVGGSGRSSLTRLGGFIRGFTTFSIEITKNYKDPQWKDDIKKLLKLAGAKNTEVVFLFSDTQIVKESFLEDINNILNTGEVPNLFVPEDLEEIITDVRPLAKEAGRLDSRDSILKYFVNLVRENLHIVLAFSPVGEKLRTRVRQFPSIINCATIDWYDKWPDEALYSVAEREYKAQEHLEIQDFREALCKLSVEIHQSVRENSERFYEELRRRNYTTPTSYLELLKLYIDMLRAQQNLLPLKIRKYTVGLQTLKETNEEVESLKRKIEEFQPKLEQSRKENTELLKDLEVKNKFASETAAICNKDASEAQQTRDEVNELRNNCKKDLDEAFPALEAAQEAVKDINKNQISEMKGYNVPPDPLKELMYAVCLLFGQKEDWETSKKLMSQMSFTQDLINFAVETTPEKRFTKLRENYISKKTFNKADIIRVSEAAGSIFVWVTAIDKFQKVKKEVAPKEKKLLGAEVKLKEVEETLSTKMAALKEVQDTVNELKRNLDNSVHREESLKQQQKTAEIQLERAKKLVNGLSSEAERWKQSADRLEADKKNLVGNILLSAAFIAYLGPFTSNYRSELLKKWIERCKQENIPTADDYTLERILSEEVQMREWEDNGLPADKLSRENGILIFNCRRWPLVIDPQNQANKWIKKLQKENNLQIVKLTETSFLKTLENCIRFGQPCLLENVEEDLDPALEPILLKQTFKKGPTTYLKLADNDVPYNPEFRFYLTSKLTNPHYLPEISIKVTLINFTVTSSGLEDQLLVEVVRFERIELEEKRVNLIIQISQDKRQLQELEDRILKQISEVQGRILDDEELINTLDASRITSETINNRMKLSKITAKEIDEARNDFRVVAKRGSVLYFVIADLALIDPMYQYSLEFFIKLFKKRLEVSEQSTDPKTRLKIIVDDITKSFYVNICRGLFEKDKLLFSFLMGIKIKMAEGSISSRLWNFFLRGPTQEPRENQEHIPYLTERAFKNMLSLSELSNVYKNLPASMRDPEESKIWKELIEASDPWFAELPPSFRNSLDDYQKLLLIKSLIEEKMVSCIKYFIKNMLGAMFIESPIFDPKSSFADSTCTTPLIFILSPGADPIVYLLDLAKEKEMETRLKMLSLGQGQGEIAAEWIKAGRRNGDWVCLQNCHLAISWLSKLERIQENQVESETHSEFRLWLTSMPTNKFPVSILQSGIKMTNEPPKGLKANLGRTFNEIKEKEYESCLKPIEYKKLLFSLAFFHAVILERRKFGAIGWNIPYEWMNSDFETCQLQLRMYLDEQPEIPYKALNVLLAEINYGGRVTDDKDMRLIKALLSKYFTPKVMQEKYFFGSNDIYHSPYELALEPVKKYIASLPLEDDPEVFGLNSNANITFQQKIIREFMDTLLEVSPRTVGAGAGGETPDEIASKLASEIELQIREPFHFNKSEEPGCLEIFRNQEVDRFNKLIKVIKTSLRELQKAIKGLVVMSLELEKMYYSFLNKKVPENWTKVSYLSLKPLGTWVADLVKRLEFYGKWLEKGTMDSYWVSSFFFPQGFMTAALQTYARKNIIPIDTLVFRTNIRDFHEDFVKEVPQDGVNIHGLFIQGARWDIEKHEVNDSLKKELFFQMPVIS